MQPRRLGGKGGGLEGCPYLQPLLGLQGKNIGQANSPGSAGFPFEGRVTLLPASPGFDSGKIRRANTPWWWRGQGSTTPSRGGCGPIPAPSASPGGGGTELLAPGTGALSWQRKCEFSPAPREITHLTPPCASPGAAPAAPRLRSHRAAPGPAPSGNVTIPLAGPGYSRARTARPWPLSRLRCATPRGCGDRAN